MADSFEDRTRAEQERMLRLQKSVNADLAAQARAFEAGSIQRETRADKGQERRDAKASRAAKKRRVEEAPEGASREYGAAERRADAAERAAKARRDEVGSVEKIRRYDQQVPILGQQQPRQTPASQRQWRGAGSLRPDWPSQRVADLHEQARLAGYESQSMLRRRQLQITEQAQTHRGYIGQQAGPPEQGTIPGARQIPPTPYAGGISRAGRGTIRTPEDQRVAPSATGEANKQLDEYANNATKARNAASQFAAEQQRLARTIGAGSDAYTKHGYLTSEFISAAARGQVSMRELGVQVGGTIAKFGGWTAAASLVYGAAAAMGSLGTGALDSLAGVTNLQRVVTNLDTSKAQGEFRKLSAEFNLPIKDVADAAYGMGKVFRDQNQIFEGTKAALFAMKVGEIDAATTTRYLTAIVAGLGLSSSDLIPVFDRINNLQNKFGGNTGQMTAGLAKSAGAFKNAGGGLEYLLALLQTGVRTTGRSGEEIGTAIARSAEIIQRPARRGKISEALGLTSKDAGDVEKVYEAFFKKVQAGASNQEISQIASTIATPQLATRLVPIAHNRQLFSNILEEASYDKSRDSSKRELDTAKQGSREQLAAIANGLQRVGSALGQSGAFDSIGVLVKGLNESLTLLTSVLGLFQQLPAPIQKGAVYLAEYAAIMGTLRRFDVGAKLGGDKYLGGFQRTEQGRGKAQVFRGIKDHKDLLQSDITRTGHELAVTNRDYGRAVTHREGLEKLTGEDAPTEAKLNQARLREIELDERRVALMLEADTLAAEQVTLAEKERTIRRQTGWRARFTGQRQDIRDASAGQGFLYAGRTNRPGKGGAIEAGDIGKPETSPAAPLTSAQRHANAQAVRARNESAAASEVEGAEAVKAGQSAENASAAAARNAGKLSKATAAIKASRVGNFTRAIAASIGPMDAFVIGIIAAYEAYKFVSATMDEQQKRLEGIDKARDSGNAFRLRKLGHAEANRHTAVGRVEEGLLGVGRAFGYGKAQRAESVDEESRRVGRQAEIDAEFQQRAQRQGRRLNLDQIRTGLKRRLSNAGGDPTATRAALRRASEQLRNGEAAFRVALEGSRGKDGRKTGSQRTLEKGRATIIQGYHDLAAIEGTLDKALEAVNGSKELDRIGKGVKSRFDLYGATRSVVKSSRATLKRAQLLAVTESDPTERAKLQATAQEQEDLLKARAEQTRDRALAVARNPAEQHRARQAFLSTTREDRTSGLRENIAEAERKLAENRRAISQLPQGSKGDMSAREGEPISERTAFARTEALPGLREAQRLLKVKISNLKQTLKKTNAELRDLVLEQHKLDYEANLGSFDTTTSYQQSTTADPLAGARINLARLRQRLADVKAHLGRGSTSDQVTENQTRINEGEQQVAQAQLARLQQNQAAALSGVGRHDDEGRARLVLAQAQQYAAAIRAQGNKVDPGTYIQAMQAVNDARNSLADYLEQQANALADARTALALASTEDPVKRADIEAEKAKADIGRAHNLPEKISAQANYREKQRAQITAHRDDKVNDAEFAHDMGTLSTGALIAFYENMLKTHKLAKAVRQDYRRRIQALKKDIEGQTNSDLNVGNLKLPTSYEVRRFTAERKAGTQYDSRTSNVVNRNVVNVVVNSPEDVPAVAKALEQHVSGINAAARAGGMR